MYVSSYVSTIFSQHISGKLCIVVKWHSFLFFYHTSIIFFVIFTIKSIFVIQLCISELSLDTKIKKVVCHLHNLNSLTFKL